MDGRNGRTWRTAPLWLLAALLAGGPGVGATEVTVAAETRVGGDARPPIDREAHARTERAVFALG